LEGNRETKCKDDFACGFYTHSSSLPAGVEYGRKKSQQAAAQRLKFHHGRVYTV
jgi:hypothetical protein